MNVTLQPALQSLLSAQPPAPAAQPPAAAAAPAGDQVQLSLPGKVLKSVGDGLAKAGLFGGAAIGAGLGLAAGIAMGGIGWTLPLVGAAVVGFEAIDASAAAEANKAGKSSDIYQRRERLRQSLTPVTAASHLMMGAAGMTSIGLGIGLIGGPIGLVTGTAVALGACFYVGYEASKAEKALLPA